MRARGGLTGKGCQAGKVDEAGATGKGGQAGREGWGVLLHPLLSLVLLISYRDARITNSRKGMSLLPEKVMKTFSQR